MLITYDDVHVDDDPQQDAAEDEDDGDEDPGDEAGVVRLVPTAPAEESETCTKAGAGNRDQKALYSFRRLFLRRCVHHEDDKSGEEQADAKDA